MISILQEQGGIRANKVTGGKLRKSLADEITTSITTSIPVGRDKVCSASAPSLLKANEQQCQIEENDRHIT